MRVLIPWRNLNDAAVTQNGRREEMFIIPDKKLKSFASHGFVQGTIVPVEITCQLLENAMNKIMVDSKGEQDKFLIDGFPRSVRAALDRLQCPTSEM